ncbi:MAG: hypothetical protein QM687_12045 [Ferruginibacter sp.]
MESVMELCNPMVNLLEAILNELQSLNKSLPQCVNGHTTPDYVHVTFKGSEVYLLNKAFIDSGGAPHENYKTMLEKLVPHLANKTQKGFSPQSFCKFSDKVDPESKENVKRFLQKMIRNIDSYD